MQDVISSNLTFVSEENDEDLDKSMSDSVASTPLPRVERGRLTHASRVQRHSKNFKKMFGNEFVATDIGTISWRSLREGEY